MKRGFTLLEVVLFSAIFSVMTLMFAGILVAVTRIQVRGEAAAEVNGESQYLLQTIQRNVERSSGIEIAADLATSSVKLRMASSTEDPLSIYVAAGRAYLRMTDTGQAKPLTSDRVVVDSLSFTRRVNPGGKDSLTVSFSMSYNTTNPQQKFVADLLTSVRRVSAATFDSNVVPSLANTYKLGVAAGDWQSVNNTLFFSGSNVGIGVTSPGQTLEVNGGARLNTGTAKPTCDASQRGTFWVTQSGGGMKDAVEVCVRNASSTYLWATIY